MARFTVPLRTDEKLHAPPPTLRAESRELDGKTYWYLAAIGLGFDYVFPVDCNLEDIQAWLQRHKYHPGRTPGEYLRE